MGKESKHRKPHASATGEGAAVATNGSEAEAPATGVTPIQPMLRALELLAGSMPILAWTTDTELRFTSITGEGLFESHGDGSSVSSASIIGQTLQQYFHGEDANFPALAAHQRALAGEPVHYTLRWAERSFRAAVEPLRDAHGAITGTLGVALDITQDQNAEAQLHEKEAEMQELLENAGDIIYTQDLNGNFTWVNQAGLRATGYTLEEVRGMHMREIVAREHREVTESMRQSRLATLGNTAPYQIEIVAKDGHRIPVEVNARLIFKAGRPAGVQGTARDISDRVRSQQSAVRNVERFSALVQHSSDVITILNQDGTIRYESPSLERIIGYRPDELVGRSLFEHIHEEDVERVRQTFRELATDAALGKVIEFRYRHKKASWRTLEMTASNRLNDPDVRGIVANCRDVTDRRRTDEALRRSEERYRLLFERNLAGVYWSNIEGELVDCNESFARMFGYQSRSEVLRHHASEFFHQSGNREAFLQELKQRKVVTNLESLCRRKDGSPIWLLENVTLMDDGSGSHLLQGTAIDITERKFAEQSLKQAEGRYRSIFENAAEGIFQISLDGRWLIANPKLAQILGYATPHELMSGVDLNRNYYMETGRRREFIRRIEKEGALYGFESQVLRKDGATIWVSESARTVRNENGHLVGFEGTVQDITERRHAEETLRMNERRLRQQNETMVRFSQRKTIERGNLSEAVAEITEATAHTLDVEHASVWFYNQDRSMLRCADQFTRSTTQHTRGNEIEVAKFPLYFKALEEERTIDSDDALTDPRNIEFREIFKQQGVTSVMDSNVRIGGKVVGVLCVEHTGAMRLWTLDEKNFCGSMADLVSLAIEAAERKRAQDALRESESKFRAVAETAASAIYIHKGDRFLFCNRATEVISGYTREELMQLNPFTVVHPEDRAMVLQRYKDRVAGLPSPERYEYRIVNKQGQSRWLDFSASLISFAGQTSLLATAFDVTERKHAEQVQAALYRIAEKTTAVRDLIEFFAAIHAIISELMYAGNMHIAIYDPHTQVLSFPYFVDEQELPPGPRKLAKGLIEHVLRTGRAYLSNTKEDQELFARGELEMSGAHSANWVGIPLQIGNVTFGVLALQSYSEPHRYGEREKEILTLVSQSVAAAIQRKRDEEALRQSEARYRSQVQSAVYGIYRSSAKEPRLLDVNPALVSMLGYNSVEEVLALDLVLDLYADPTERGRLVKEYRQKERIEGAEVQWKRKDGKIITVRLSGRAVLDESGEAETFEMLAEDITERRFLEEQLRQSQKMEAVGRLAGGVAHDFNNLLTVIKGYSELVLDQIQPGDSMRSSIEEVKKAADRAAALTRQLLAFSRKQVLAPKVIDLNAIVSNMEKLLRRLIGENIELISNLDPNLGRAKSDPGQTEQVVMNLAVNARDAMPGGGALTITTSNAVITEEMQAQSFVPAGNYVRLDVADTGTGMDEDTRSRIFEPFFTTKEQGKGTGLGLSTVYGIVKQSGGFIEVASELTKGSTFSIYLPSVEQKAEREALAVPVLKRTGDETILLVEDEDGVRALARQLLQKQGYTVLDTRHGDEALEVCSNHPNPIHLLLTDVVLAKMSGHELAGRLTTMRPELRVLYMSGYSGDAVALQGVLDSGVAFLQKPFSTESLLSKVREVLDMPRTPVTVQ